MRRGGWARAYSCAMRAGCAITLAGAILHAGCVTEDVSPTRGHQGVRLRPGDTPVTAANPRGPRAVQPPAQPIPLPAGPIAEPATGGQTVLSSIQVGVVPLGTVVYDGQTLPLTSPDGGLVAVQDGEAPMWEAILAEPSVQITPRSTVAIYRLSDRALERVPPMQELPRGLLLGRATDDRGVLVELPQADGGRWIGRLTWAGALEWLVQGSSINSHAVFTPQGDLLFTRRALESDSNDLVLLSRGGPESVRPAEAGSYEFPMCTGDRSAVYALRLSNTGIELEAIRLDRAGPEGPGRLGGTIARRTMQPKPDRLLAYQISGSCQPALPLRRAALIADQPLAIFHPRLGRMAAFRLDTSNFEPLAPASMAAVASDDPDRPGFFCSTVGGLVFSPTTTRGPGQDVPAIRVVSSAYVPRKVAGTPETMMLFGPVKGRADVLEVVKLVVGAGEGQPATPGSGG